MVQFTQIAYASFWFILCASMGYEITLTARFWQNTVRKRIPLLLVLGIPTYASGTWLSAHRSFSLLLFTLPLILGLVVGALRGCRAMHPSYEPLTAQDEPSRRSANLPCIDDSVRDELRRIVLPRLARFLATTALIGSVVWLSAFGTVHAIFMCPAVDFFPREGDVAQRVLSQMISLPTVFWIVSVGAIMGVVTQSVHSIRTFMKDTSPSDYNFGACVAGALVGLAQGWLIQKHVWGWFNGVPLRSPVACLGLGAICGLLATPIIIKVKGMAARKNSSTQSRIENDGAP